MIGYKFFDIATNPRLIFQRAFSEN